MKLEFNITIPILDDLIDENEINVALKGMKKSGYDLPILTILITSFTLLIMNILNMFYVKYPVTLANSLLSIIPKKGNLMLPKNFRGF